MSGTSSNTTASGRTWQLFEIPLTANPQTFDIVLSRVAYQLTLIYRDAPDAGWLLDIADDQGNPLICGMPLITGTDLLGQFRYVGINGMLVVGSDGNPDAVPDFADLGSSSHLYFLQFTN